MSAPNISEEDVFALRRRPSFNARHKVIRLLWTIVWNTLFRWTPKQMRPWRVFLLRCFGARIGYHSDVRGSVRVFYPGNLVMGAHSVLADGVDCYNMAMLSVGDYTIVSQRVYLCGGTHDYTVASNPLITRPISIGSKVWIAAEAMVAPGCVVADGCVVGARAMVHGRLEPWSVYSGNPARRIRERSLDATR